MATERSPQYYPQTPRKNSVITVGSLFSGIGGIDLGLERAGMTVKWQSEIEPYSCRVLKKHWPDVPNLGNIKEINWEEVERVDVIAGGYPCQPFSLAGQRKGTDDPRHLWPYFLRAISELRPRFALLENVRGHLSMGLDRVLADLTSIGYDAEWQIVRASDIGANHRRERLIIVAYPDERAMERGIYSGISPETIEGRREVFLAPTSSRGNAGALHFPRFPESGVGRIAHGIPNRLDRLRGLGNAVVPQVAEYVGRVIVEMLTPI